MTRRFDPKRKQSAWTSIPAYVRSLMLFQFLLILVMGGWLYLEYTHNVYLQSYLRTALQANPAILQLGIPGVLGAISVGLYAKLNRTNREIALIEAQKAVPPPRDSWRNILNSLPELEDASAVTVRAFGDTQFRRPRGKYHGLNRISEIQKLPYLDEEDNSA